MIDERELTPIPCLLTMDKDKTIRLYDVRFDHPDSLIISFRIERPEKTGFAMLSMYGHLRRSWIQGLYKRLKKACKQAKEKDGVHNLNRPTKFKKKWEAARKKRTLFDSEEGE